MHSERPYPVESLQRVAESEGRLRTAVRPDVSVYLWGPLASSVPSVDVRETDTHVIVTADVPGVNPQDLEVTITEEALTIKGEVRMEENVDQHGFRRLERRYGAFHRVIPFPTSIKHEQAVADCTNGVLEVKVPKAEPRQSRSIRLNIGKERDGTH